MPEPVTECQVGRMNAPDLPPYLPNPREDNPFSQEQKWNERKRQAEWRMRDLAYVPDGLAVVDLLLTQP